MTEPTDIPHLRQIVTATVADLCERAVKIAADSYSLRIEIEGFRISRTPWDATRLANALDNLVERSAAVQSLVADLDAAAEDCAGLVPSNRHARRL